MPLSNFLSTMQRFSWKSNPEQQMDNSAFDARYNMAPKAFHDWMKEKIDFRQSTILDFGADTGVMALGLIEHCQIKKLIGVDINENYKNLLQETHGRLNLNSLPENLLFKHIKPGESLSQTFANEKIDCIFSWSVFEHVNQLLLPKVAQEITKTIRPGGYAFIQIAPLYYSAFGSHMDMLIPQPWSHLTTQLDLYQNQILQAKKNNLYAGEADKKFQKTKESLWGIFAELNKITADELLNLFLGTGLSLVRQHRTKTSHIPPSELTAIYREDILTTEQIVCLFQKN